MWAVDRKPERRWPGGSFVKSSEKGDSVERLGQKIDRKRVLIRLLYTLLYLFVFELIKTVIQLCVLFQYVYLLISGRTNEPIRTFSNRVVSYAYSVMRYLTLTGNRRPFPFTELPPDLEPPVDPVRFD